MKNEIISCIFTYYDKPDRFPALYDIHANLEDDIFWYCFHKIWTNSESIFLNFDKILEMFQMNNRMTSKECFKQLEDDDKILYKSLKRRKKIKIYRGISFPQDLHISKARAGFSWTTSQNRASFFATRWPYPHEIPVVIGYTICPEDFICCYTGRDENELLVVGLEKHDNSKFSYEFPPVNNKTRATGNFARKIQQLGLGTVIYPELENIPAVQNLKTRKQISEIQDTTESWKEFSNMKGAAKRFIKKAISDLEKCGFKYNLESYKRALRQIENM